MKREKRMREQKLLDAFGGIDTDLLTDAELLIDAERSGKAKKTRPMLLKRSGMAAGLCAAVAVVLAVSLMLPHMGQMGGETGGTEEVGVTLIPNGEYWIDQRERNGKTWLTESSARIWPWHCMEVYEQFCEIEFQGTRYSTRVGFTGDSIDPSLVGEKIGSGVMTGYDVYKEETHETTADVYAILGVDSERFIAVRYAGHSECYVFSAYEETAQTTLGGLITSLNLKETFPLTDCIGAESVRGESDGPRYALTTADSDALWEIFLRYADASRLASPADLWSDKKLTFVIHSDALGATNLGWWIDSDGYLGTNIENFGYYYHIGTEAVEEILAYVMAHKTDAAPREQVQYLVGTVTEIGADYIKIDDTSMMKNPEDGIVFTVYANDTRIRRYITSGFLRVGQTVVIEHGGIHRDEPTVVRTATILHEGFVTDGGTVIVPE